MVIPTSAIRSSEPFSFMAQSPISLPVSLFSIAYWTHSPGLPNNLSSCLAINSEASETVITSKLWYLVTSGFDRYA
ncbi:hypothetical protein D9M70_584130 [compost metagenome]